MGNYLWESVAIDRMTDGAMKRHVSSLKFHAYFEKNYRHILETLIDTLQSDTKHRYYQDDETVRIYDLHHFYRALRLIRGKFGSVRVIDIISPVVFEFLYKGNHVAKVRSAIRIRPIALRAMILYLLENCPADRLDWCNEVNASCISLYHKCLLISHHIPAYRPTWYACRPEYQDSQIALTYTSLLIKAQLSAQFIPDNLL